MKMRDVRIGMIVRLVTDSGVREQYKSALYKISAVYGYVCTVCMVNPHTFEAKVDDAESRRAGFIWGVEFNLEPCQFEAYTDMPVEAQGHYRHEHRKYNRDL